MMNIKNEIITYNYIAGDYEVFIQGDAQHVMSELDRLLDFYRNEMEAYSYNSGEDYIERLKDEGFEVEVIENE